MVTFEVLTLQIMKRNGGDIATTKLAFKVPNDPQIRIKKVCSAKHSGKNHPGQPSSY